ncbi:MAG: hypothetical protein ACKJSG_03925 [Lentisphaeria bacterium]|jgi:prepilin-type processing-associated H-X9-DG protein
MNHGSGEITAVWSTVRSYGAFVGNSRADGDGVNIVFHDGHGKWVRQSDLERVGSPGRDN